ncbi:MAG: glycosyltransferase family 2 protein [Planctomycetota bacterium]|jgi:glycosyltransferase involved in cell wall biosynthesis
MPALVSVVMTSYNHEKFLPDAIDSVLNQTYEDFELIIIDDASSDRSQEIIGHFQQKDPRIRPIFHDRNMGISRTTNDGFMAAKGEYVAYVQSDDLWIPDKLEKQLTILEGNPDLVVWSDAAIIDEMGNSTGRLFTEKYHAECKPKSGNLFLSLSRSNYICGQSMILKTQVAQAIQFDPGFVYANDYKFMLELSRQCDFYFINEPLVQYRIHGDNSITKNKHIWARDDYYLSRYLLTNYVQELSKNVIAKCYKQMGVHLHNQGHLGYARKCFGAAIRNNSKKTSYYKKFIKSSAQSLLS